MELNQVQLVIDGALNDRRLLSHPFYKRWTAGELQPEELKAYAEQYRHFEASLPHTLQAIIDELPAGDSRTFIEDNLADEAGHNGHPSHLELFNEFAAAAGADAIAEPTPATQALLDAYGAAVAAGPVAAMGALLAYETQAAEVASTKSDGLQNLYGYDAQAARFWDVHGTLDIEHGRWATAALASAATSAEEFAFSTQQVADAWWNFLNEREACAAA